MGELPLLIFLTHNVCAYGINLCKMKRWLAGGSQAAGHLPLRALPKNVAVLAPSF